MDKLKEHWQSKNIMEWHRRQFFEPKRNLIYFEKFLSAHQNLRTQYILDLACGGGAEDVYLVSQNPGLRIQGVDYVESAFSIFDELASEDMKSVISLSKGDWFNMDKKYVNVFDGVISLETLSWLEDWMEPIEKIIEINPRWICLSSLFYEGKISYQIKLRDYEQTESKDGFDESYYNIYSIPILREFLYERGYKIFDYEKFQIDIDIPRPSHMGTGTYTVNTEQGERLQISGALQMPWYFVYAER